MTAKKEERVVSMMHADTRISKVPILILLTLLAQSCFRSNYIITSKDDSSYKNELSKNEPKINGKIIFLGFHSNFFTSALANMRKPLGECLMEVDPHLEKYSKIVKKFPFIEEDFFCYRGAFPIIGNWFIKNEIIAELSDQSNIESKEVISENKLREITEILLKGKLSLFFREYLQLFSTEGDKIYFNKRKVNFYVIGINEPIFHINTTRGKIIKYSTGLISAFSVGILPVFQENLYRSSYYIFDKDLNKLSEVHYSGKYWVYTTSLSSFVPWNHSHSYSTLDIHNANQPIVFAENLLEFKKHLKEFCEKNGC